MQHVSQKHKSLADLPHLGFQWNLDRYEPWNHDCTFEVSFARNTISLVHVNPDHLRPYEILAEGRFEPASGKLNDAFKCAATNAGKLSHFGQYNVFMFGSYFERKDKNQTYEFPSSITLVHNRGSNKLKFTYRGEPSDGVPAIAHEAQSIIERSSLALPGSFKANSDSFQCLLSSSASASVDLLFELIDRLGSGKVFSHYWSASMKAVDEENVNKHGFELYNRLAESGLMADEIKVLFKLQFLDMWGLDVVRQLCEGETHYTIPLGTFRHRKKKAILGVFTNKDGHRLSLTLKEAPTEQEWAHLETVLNTKFDRKPFAP
jgi:hypothetical protein